MKKLFSEKFLEELFPPKKSDDFFDALYGGAESGAFDITLAEEGLNEKTNELYMYFLLTERPGKCMACHLTSGLPGVFERHPVIDLKGIAKKIEEILAPDWSINGWSVGSTMTKGPKENMIPFILKLNKEH